MATLASDIIPTGWDEPLRLGKMINEFVGASRIESLEQRVLFGAGDLDTTFNRTGFLPLDLGSTVTISKIAVQVDSKIVVAGTTGTISNDGNITNGDFFLARYNADGTPDTSFGDHGIVRTDLGGNDIAAAVGIDSQGRIIVAGTGGPNVDFAVARYTTGGVLDANFSGDGEELIPFGGQDSADFLAIMPGDKILLVGSGSTAGVFAAARLKTDGSFDNTFSGDGTETLTFTADGGGFKVASVNAISAAANGDVFFAGDVGDGDRGRPYVARILPDGSLDTEFGIVSIGSDDTSTFALAALGNESAFLSASDQSDTLYGLNYVIGSDGSQTDETSIPNNYLPSDLLVQADGRIILVGTPNIDSNEGFGTFRGIFLSRGSVDTSNRFQLDSTFGNDDGVSYTSFAHRDRTDVVASALDPQGHIVVLLQSFNADSNTSTGYLLTRFDEAGSDHPAPFATLTSHGTLSVQGTFGSDQIEVATEEEDVAVDQNGLMLEFPGSLVKRMVISGDDGNDKISVEVKRNSTILGGNGNDTIFGGAGADVINGANGNDKIHGGDGDDTIVGGRGHDRLYGDAGDDLLIARDNLRDTLYGGDGNDQASIDSKKIKDLWGEIETLL